jgi:tRNA threonylcarbamoyladenosine biosynthesis protein TsaE
MIINSISDAQTQKAGSSLAANLNGGEVLCLYGDLGAGKTTFLHGLVHFYLPKKRVLSPTFIIVRHYEVMHHTIKIFLHADLYRLENIQEIADIGLFERIYKKDTIIAIEWAEKLGSLLPKKRIDIYFSIGVDDTRRIQIKKYG